MNILKEKLTMFSKHRLFLLAFFALNLALAQAETLLNLTSITHNSLSDSSIDLTTGSRTATKLYTTQIRMLLGNRNRISSQSDCNTKTA